MYRIGISGEKNNFWTARSPNIDWSLTNGFRCCVNTEGLGKYIQ